MNISQVIVRPVLTEKASSLTTSNVYTFEVHEKANKNNVAHVLEAAYKVKVGTVRMLKRKGKSRIVGKKRQSLKLPDVKIAYVTLTTGKIDLFPSA